MTMSKDDWKAGYAKDDNLKLTKVGGNKIRRITIPPIFSSRMLDILLIEWCYQERKSFGSSTRSTWASSNPDTLGRAITMEKTHHWSRDIFWWINGDDLEAYGCTTLRSKDHMIEIIDIFGWIHKKILFSSMSSLTSEANSSIFLDIQKLHEVPVPKN